MRDKEIDHAVHSAGTRDGINADHNSKNQKDRHHDARDAFDPVLNAHVNNDEVEEHENTEPDLGRRSACDKVGEKGVRSDGLHISGEKRKEIFAHPSSDNGIIRTDQNRDDRVDPPAGLCIGRVAVVDESAHRTFLCRAPDRCLSDDHRIAKCEGKDDIYKKKSAAAVLSCQIRESPDVAQSHGRTRSREHKSQLTCE